MGKRKLTLIQCILWNNIKQFNERIEEHTIEEIINMKHKNKKYNFTLFELCVDKTNACMLDKLINKCGNRIYEIDIILDKLLFFLIPQYSKSDKNLDDLFNIINNLEGDINTSINWLPYELMLKILNRNDITYFNRSESLIFDIRKMFEDYFRYNHGNIDDNHIILKTILKNTLSLKSLSSHKEARYISAVYFENFIEYDLPDLPPFFDRIIELYGDLNKTAGGIHTKTMYLITYLAVYKNKTLFNYLIQRNTHTLEYEYNLIDIYVNWVLNKIINNSYTIYILDEEDMLESKEDNDEVSMNNLYGFEKLADIKNINIFTDTDVYYLSKFLNANLCNKITYKCVKHLLKRAVVPYMFPSLTEISLNNVHIYEIKHDHTVLNDIKNTYMHLCFTCGDYYYRNPDTMHKEYKTVKIKNYSFCSLSCQNRFNGLM